MTVWPKPNGEGTKQDPTFTNGWSLLAPVERDRRGENKTHSKQTPSACWFVGWFGNPHLWPSWVVLRMTVYILVCLFVHWICSLRGLGGCGHVCLRLSQWAIILDTTARLSSNIVIVIVVITVTLGTGIVATTSLHTPERSRNKARGRETDRVFMTLLSPLPSSSSSSSSSKRILWVGIGQLKLQLPFLSTHADGHLFPL